MFKRTLKNELRPFNEELFSANWELQKKEEQLFALNSDIENLNIGAVFLDEHFNIRKYTAAITDHFQISPKDIGQPIANFSGILEGEDLVSYSQNVLKTLKPFKVEVRNTDGHWFMLQIFPYRNHENNIKGVAIHFVDIDDLLHTVIEEKEKLNDFLSHVTSSNPAIIYIYDVIRRQNIYSSNDIWEIAGYSTSDTEELGDQFLANLVHPDDLENLYKHHEKLKGLRNGKVIQQEFRIIHKKTKRIIWILSSDKVNTRDKNGAVRTIMGTAQVITQIKNIELKLKESEERFRLAIKGTQSGMWEWANLEENKAWYSKEFCQLLGYTSKEMQNSYDSFTNLIHPNYKKIYTDGLEAHIRDTIPFDEEIKIETKKNGYKWFIVNGQMQDDKNSKSTKKIVGTLLDITSKKQSESKMRELNKELERFAYLASHDLKEPLNTVVSFLKLLKDEYGHQFDEQANKYIHFVDKASNRMIDLTNDLLVYSQLGNNKSLHFKKVDLNVVLKDIKEDLHESIKESNTSIYSNKLPSLVGDPMQLKQLFQNLISNSIKYRTDKSPEIEIKAKKKTNKWEFSIVDNGIGIDKKYHSEVFEVFKRLHNQNKYKGTGIGLANCKRIVNNHNGKISIDPTYTKGTKFVFTILKMKL